MKPPASGNAFLRLFIARRIHAAMSFVAYSILAWTGRRGTIRL
jgi:hypothetical protein